MACVLRRLNESGTQEQENTTPGRAQNSNNKQNIFSVLQRLDRVATQSQSTPNGMRAIIVPLPCMGKHDIIN